jgi:nucleoside-diphosphate-sugar epimerase
MDQTQQNTEQSENLSKPHGSASKRVLVTGAGGFIGSWLVKRLKQDGHWVRGVDIKYPEYSATHADEFLILDLRD